MSNFFDRAAILAEATSNATATMSKETILAAVNTLPENIELDELIDRLIFIEKVEEGLRDSEAGHTISHEDVKKIAQSWSR